jgi:hypothetical protein
MSVQDYFTFQREIKDKLKKLEPECPYLVLRYLLKNESSSRIHKIENCEYIDKFDKKMLIELSRLDDCKGLRGVV